MDSAGASHRGQHSVTVRGWPPRPAHRTNFPRRSVTDPGGQTSSAPGDRPLRIKTESKVDATAIAARRSARCDKPTARVSSR